MRLYEEVLRASAAGTIPATAVAKLEAMREQRDIWRDRGRSLGEKVQDARRLLSGLEMEYAALVDSYGIGGLRKFANDGRGGRNVSSGSQTLEQSQQAMDRQNAEIRRLNAKAEEARSAAAEIGSSLQQLELWLDSVGRANLRPFSGTTKVKPHAGEGWVAAVDRLRQTIAEVKAERHRVASAPIPASEAKALMRSEIEALAEAGTPDVSPCLEGGVIRWPVAPLVRGDGSIITYQALNAHALLVWLDRDRLIKRLEEEIDAASDPALAMTAEQRRIEDGRLASALLKAEREEEALIVAAAAELVNIPRRADADPRAVLELADNVPGYVEEE